MATDAPIEDASASPELCAPSWDPTDTSSLLPAHLPVSRPIRAYERTPASPFTRNRFRVGKVWKRHAVSALARKAPIAAPRRDGSPVQVVKRMRDGRGEGVDMRWERVGSPVKRARGVERIVTRSMRGEELVELAEKEELGAGGGRVGDGDMICEERGLGAHVSGAVMEDEVWVDEHEDEHGEEEADDPRLVDPPLGDAPKSDSTVVLRAHAEAEDIPSGSAQGLVHEDEASEEMRKVSGECTDTLNLVSARESIDALPSQPIALPSTSGPLPAGFVSPVKRHRSVSKKLSMAADRRRTLPGTFTPSMVAATNSTVESQAPAPLLEDAQAPVAALAISKSHDMISEDERAEPNALCNSDTGPDDDEWEDVDEKDIVPLLSAEKQRVDTAGSGLQPHNEGTPQRGEEPDGAAVDLEPVKLSIGVERMAPALDEDPNSPLAQAVAIQEQLIAHELSPRSQPSPRRSPRRKSASPVKQMATSSFAESIGLPSMASLRQAGVPFHHVEQALFLSMFTSGSPSGGRDGDRADDDHLPSDRQTLADTLLPCVERSSSAPPESPRLSPHRPPRPRVSDDTALLQAFIKRANQCKTARRSSIAKRESLENRRESDTVRQALASPAKEDVLADLDPNTASPRKAAVEEAVQVAELASSPLRDVVADDDGKPRRSLRRTQRRSASAALPNKISLRGNAEPFVLRRGEAHELERVTRANTRKNKAGSIMPTLRITKLAAEKTAEPEIIESVTVTETVSNDGKRRIQWDQTLNYYSDAPPPISPPTSDDEEAEPDKQLTSELTEASVAAADAMQVDSAPSIQEQAIELSARSASAGIAPNRAVPAAETPSKPKRKVRKLAAPRTAAAPGLAPVALSLAAPMLEAVTAVAETKVNPLKRSRIATPAKPTALPMPVAALDKALPLPSATPRLVPRKRPIASRLPAPASNLPTQVSDSKSAPSLLASPPKKKSSSTSGIKNASVTAKIPKLDFGGSSLASFAKSETECFGLSASPAKRVGRVFVAAKEDEGQGRTAEIGTGMGSPAKKRGRRV